MMGAPRRGAAARLLAFAGAVALGVACTDLPSGPEPFSIEFLPLPFPAVVIGDTLRDEDGVAAPLRAHLFDLDGDTVSGAEARFFALDSGVRVDTAAGWVIGGPAPVSRVRIVARAGDLPAAPQDLAVVQRPDSLALASPEVDTVLYNLAQARDLETFAVNSDAIAAQVLHVPAGAEPAGVGGWLVRYTLLFRGDTVPAGDSSRGVWLVDDGTRASVLDTTGSDGGAGRRVRVRPSDLAAGTTGGTDSVTVVVTARHQGQPLAGAERQVKLLLCPVSGCAAP